MSSETEKNKAIVRRFLEELVKGNIDVIDELHSPDFVDRALMPGQGPTREDYRQTIEEILDAFFTTNFTIEGQVAEGDLVVTKYTEHGVSRGEFASLPPTGQEETEEGIYIHRVSGGKITEEYSIIDPRPAMETRAQEIRKRERIEQELTVARHIQQASLPKEAPTLAGWQISPFYQPAREVGGDFYDFFELEDGRVGVVVGDATGKGMPAALMAEATSNMLRAVAQALGSSSPGEVLERVNETLLARIPPNMFVTCFYAILDPKSGSLTYANAGHDLPYLRRRNGEAEELRARGMPLGLMPGMSYEEKEIELEGGEGVLFTVLINEVGVGKLAEHLLGRTSIGNSSTSLVHEAAQVMVDSILHDLCLVSPTALIPADAFEGGSGGLAFVSKSFPAIEHVLLVGS